MTEVSSWNESDASNNSASPAGWPEGMLPSGVNNSARAMMGATKRFWDRVNPVYPTTGSSNAYVVTPTEPLAAYVNYEVWRIRPNFSNTGAATINISALGAKTLKKYAAGSKTDLVSGDLQIGQSYSLWYDGTHFVVENPEYRATAMSNPMTTRGDIISGAASGVPQRLAVGASGRYLRSDGTDPSWAAIAAADLPAASTSAQGAGTLTTQTLQEGASGNTLVTPGTQQFHPSALKAWAEWNGNGTVGILASYNVSGVTDNGTGLFTVAWDTDFSSANYGITGLCKPNGVSNAGVMLNNGGTLSAAAAQVNTQTFGGTDHDAARISLMAAGDL